jgi:hypothetical protein
LNSKPIGGTYDEFCLTITGISHSGNPNYQYS